MTLLQIVRPAFLAMAVTCSTAALAQPLPIFDAHVHYSHDSVELTPPERVIEIMRKANLKAALVSSSDDKGTQLLYELAPDLIVPGLRPYRRRGELGTWFNDPAALEYVRERLQKHRYASIGEFHLSGEQVDTPIAREIVKLAAKHNLILHAHSDADAVNRIFAQNPTAKVIWAHSGFASPEEVGKMLEKYSNLWADLAFRSDMGYEGQVDSSWKAVFEQFPNRFMVGTDTFTPERIYYIPEHAKDSRGWLKALPKELAEKIAWRNAYELIMPVWNKNKPKEKTSALSAPIAKACDQSTPAVQTFSHNNTTIMVRTEPAIKVSEPFTIVATVCNLEPSEKIAALKFDAMMPAHGHGMNYQPKAVEVDDTSLPTYRIEGVVLHMPGEWEWQFELLKDSGKVLIAQTMQLE